MSRNSYFLLLGLQFSVACNGDKTVEEEQIEDTASASDTTPPSETDIDGDGIANEDDIDSDGDGIPVTEDCDDSNAELLSTAEDLDCDGIVDSEDFDQDGDGLEAASDCDDRNPDSTSTEDDEDCDGVLTPDDCNDTDDTLGSNTYDVDCDGYISIDDCDDRDSTSTVVIEDTDCDGIINEEDAFPDDPTESVDSDQDGVGDNSDLCEGSDDTIDEDLNGVPDACDAAGWENCAMSRSASEANYHFIGENEDDRLGTTITFAGDVDGDGLDDILIGARPYDYAAAGTVYLFLGSSLGSDGAIDLSAADYTFIPENPAESFGYALAAAGDVDGDGLDDLLFGARSNNSGYSNAGAVYLIRGSSLGIDPIIDMEDADIKFISDNYENWLGENVSSAGDVDGDGLDDILIGTLGSYYDGALLFLSTNIYDGVIDINSADYTFPDRSSMIVPAGDVDGDGLDDFMIGNAYDSNYVSNGGSVGLFLGSSLGTEYTLPISEADYIFYTSTGWAQIGGVISSAGDVDGDGLDDLLIGYSDYSGAFLFYGASLATSTTHEIPMEDADHILYGDTSVGRRVAAAGDIDGDGLDDILVSESSNDQGGSNAGAVHLVLAHTLGNNVEQSLQASSYQIVGENNSDYLGGVSRRPGDVDGDGVPDILVASIYNSDGGLNAGKVSLFLDCEN